MAIMAIMQWNAHNYIFGNHCYRDMYFLKPKSHKLFLHNFQPQASYDYKNYLQVSQGQVVIETCVLEVGPNVLEVLKWVVILFVRSCGSQNSRIA